MFSRKLSKNFFYFYCHSYLPVYLRLTNTKKEKYEGLLKFNDDIERKILFG